MPAGCGGRKNSDLEQGGWKEQWAKSEVSDRAPGGHYTNSGFPLRQEQVTQTHPSKISSRFLVSHCPYEFFLMCLVLVV